MSLEQGFSSWRIWGEMSDQRRVREQIERIENDARTTRRWRLDLACIGGSVLWLTGERNRDLHEIRAQIPPVETHAWFKSPRDFAGRRVTKRWRMPRMPDVFPGSVPLDQEAFVEEWVEERLFVRVDARANLLEALPCLSTIDLLCLCVAHERGLLLERLDDPTLWRWRWHQSPDAQRVAREILGRDRFPAHYVCTILFDDTRVQRCAHALVHLFRDLDEDREGPEWRDFLAGGWPHLRA